MNHTILCEPVYTAVEVNLEPGEKIIAESGAMAWKTPSIKTETSSKGGLMAGLKRKLLSGESFFQNTYYAEDTPGSVALVPGTPGDIVAHELSGDELLLERGAYLASTEDITVDSKWEGLKGFFKEGLFALRVTGSGMLFFNAYGDIQEVNVDGEYVIDNGYAVAWEPHLEQQITRGKSVRSFLFSDQLLVRFRGQGRIWVQSRSPQSLAEWVYPFREVAGDD